MSSSSERLIISTLGFILIFFCITLATAAREALETGLAALGLTGLGFMGVLETEIDPEVEHESKDVCVTKTELGVNDGLGSESGGLVFFTGAMCGVSLGFVMLDELCLVESTGSAFTFRLKIKMKY